FQKTSGGSATTYTVPPDYVSVLSSWTDTSRTDATKRSVRGRITITRPIGLDNNDQPTTLDVGTALTVQYTASGGGKQNEKNVTYPSRLGHDVEPVIAGLTTPKSGDVVPVSMGVNAV